MDDPKILSDDRTGLSCCGYSSKGVLLSLLCEIFLQLIQSFEDFRSTFQLAQRS